MPRRLLYVVPAFATLVAGYALLGPGRGRTIMGCRALVADDADGKLRSVRLQVVERLADIEEPRAVDGVRVRVNGIDAWQGSTASDGVIELSISDPKEGPNLIEARWGDSVLAAGNVESRRAPMPHQSSEAGGTSTGTVVLHVSIPRGQLIPPFAENVAISAAKEDGSRSDGVVKLSIEGGSITPETIALHEGQAIASITPSVAPVTLTVKAELANGATGVWSGDLPVSLGSIWVDPRSTRSHLDLAVRSPHAEAFVSLYDSRGRFGGLAIPLRIGDDGMARGGADFAAKGEGPVTAIVATDPQERGLTTLAWPIDPQIKAFGQPPLRPSLDGIPGAALRESTRLSRVRRVTAAFLGAATLLEMALLLIESRRTRRELSSHFAESSDDLDEPLAEGVTRALRTDEDGRNGPQSMVVSAKSTAIVLITVGLLLALSAATLAALSYASS